MHNVAVPSITMTIYLEKNIFIDTFQHIDIVFKVSATLNLGFDEIITILSLEKCFVGSNFCSYAILPLRL